MAFRLGADLKKILKMVPKGVLIMFPTYFMMDKFFGLWKDMF